MSDAGELYREGRSRPLRRRAGDAAQAWELPAGADRLLDEAGLVLDPADRPEYELTVELA